MAELPEVFRSESLPEKVEDLAKFVLIAPDVFKAQTAEIKAMQKLGVAKEIMDIKAQDLQRAGLMYVDAEVRLGKITQGMEKVKANQYEVQSPQCGQSKRQQLKEIGLSSQRASELEKMANHPDCVEKEKIASRIENRLPSNRNILKLIKEKDDPSVHESFHEKMEIVDAQIIEAEEAINELHAQPLIDAFELIRFIDIRKAVPELMKYYGSGLEKVTREISKMMMAVQIKAEEIKENAEE